MRSVAEVSRMDHPKDEHPDGEALQRMSRMGTTQRRESLSIPAAHQDELTLMEEVWAYRLISFFTL